MKRRRVRHQVMGICLLLLMAHFMPNCCDCRGSGLRFHPPTLRAFPYLEISGNHYEIGYAIGSHFKREIQIFLNRRKNWFSRLKVLARGDKHRLFESLKAKADAYFPALMEELSGMSEGSGIPLDDLFLINIKAEISATPKKKLPDIPGCSSVYLTRGHHKWLFHNEDGHSDCRDLMFVVKATLPTGVSILSLCTPGHLMGNGPSMNSHGIIQTTNFISGLACETGIPRYFLGRAVLEASSLEDAVETVTHPDRAFPYHHNLASVDENRILSIEVTPDHDHIEEPGTLYVHTNHLLQEGARRFPQDNDYVQSSSLSRYSVITRALKKISETGPVDQKAILKILSSHQNSPYSPCRHPAGEVRGITLATAVFDITRGTMTLYKGNPCRSVPAHHFSVYSFRKEWVPSGFKGK